MKQENSWRENPPIADNILRPKSKEYKFHEDLIRVRNKLLDLTDQMTEVSNQYVADLYEGKIENWNDFHKLLLCITDSIYENLCEVFEEFDDFV